MEKIVTKDWLKRRLENDTTLVLGRALVAIYNNQTDDEQFAFATKELNGRGFTAYDAKLGTQAAIMFIATGTLPEWLARVWLVEKAGYPRICKYVRQLNEIANAKKHVAV